MSAPPVIFESCANLMRSRLEEAKEVIHLIYVGQTHGFLIPKTLYIPLIYIVQESKDGEKGNYVGCFHLPPCGGIHCCECKCNSSSSSAGNRASVLSSRLSLLLVCRKGTKHSLCTNMLQ
ncbi:hypothetical protein Peur_006900 [Populus x canadensis]